MPHSTRAYLAALRIPIWHRRGFPAPIEAHADPSSLSRPLTPEPEERRKEEDAPSMRTSAAVSAAASVTGSEAANAALRRIETRVEACTRCDLHRTRNRVVFGTGTVKADCMLIGEAPGAEEDRRGEPFVGRAGKLLDAMLIAIGFHRDRVYIANMIKCRPPNNRNPVASEVESCAQYLAEQIDAVSPRLLVAVGRVAAQRLLATTEAMGKLRGRIHRHEPTGLPLLVMYHPAYLLRSPKEKRKAWQDLLRLRSTLEGIPSS